MYFIIFKFFFLIFFLGLHLQHIEAPRLGVKSQPRQHQIQAASAVYAAACGNKFNP